MFVEQSLTKNADGEGDDEAGCVRLEPAVPCSLWPHFALGVGGHSATQPRSSPKRLFRNTIIGEEDCTKSF